MYFQGKQARVGLHVCGVGLPGLSLDLLVALGVEKLGFREDISIWRAYPARVRFVTLVPVSLPSPSLFVLVWAYLPKLLDYHGPRRGYRYYGYQDYDEDEDDFFD
jgi:hypothetical protein